jgi:glycosyltransferase involved in cell wall biosynthesis
MRETESDSPRIGVVIIGRNEGDRLIRSLDSVVDGLLPIVYVDSGSTDGSCEAARQRGVEVVKLDLSVPFTAARARNAGFERLRQQPGVVYVQFIDGDCEVVEGWIEAAAKTLDTDAKVVAVCGWRRERYPERSPYNCICDIEWHLGEAGAALSLGGDVMIRVESLIAVGGYNDSLIAGEDEELGVRLRQAGGLVWRIDRNSTIHDADMHTVFQWWQRAKRCGHAYAQVSQMHDHPPEYKFKKELRRTLLWGGVVPLSVLVLMIPTKGLSLFAFGRYFWTILKVTRETQKHGHPQSDSLVWGLSCAISVFPETIGVGKFYFDRLGNRQHQLIEYKNPKMPS